MLLLGLVLLSQAADAKAMTKRSIGIDILLGLLLKLMLKLLCVLVALGWNGWCWRVEILRVISCRWTEVGCWRGLSLSCLRLLRWLGLRR